MHVVSNSSWSWWVYVKLIQNQSFFPSPTVSLRKTWPARKTNNQVLEDTKPEFFLDAKMMKQGLSSFGHLLRRQDSLAKSIMLGKVEGSRRRGRPNVR